MVLFAKVVSPFFICLGLFLTSLQSPSTLSKKIICEQYTLIQNSLGKYGLADLKGKQILNFEFLEIKINCNTPDLIFAKKKEGYEMYTADGLRILNFEIQEFKPSKFEEIGMKGSFYKFMKTDGNYLELHIPDSQTYKFINKPRGHNSVRVEQTYNLDTGLSLWSYKVKKNNYDSNPIYAHICFTITCFKNYSSDNNIEKLKKYSFKGVAILPDGTIHLYKNDGRYFELQ